MNIKEEIEKILKDVYYEGVNTGQVAMGVIDYSDDLNKLTTLIKKERESAEVRLNSVLVKLWDFFALEVDHHGKQRGCGNIPSLIELHRLLKERGLIKGSGQFSDKGKEYLKTLEVQTIKSGGTLTIADAVNQGGVDYNVLVEKVSKLTDYITKSNREVLEDYRCKVTQGILSQVQDNVELTKFINDLDQAYLSQLNKEGK